MKKGFTLVEFVIVLGIFLGISLILVPISVSQLQKTRVEDVVKDISSRIFLYQQNAYAGSENKNYGIAFTANKFTLFTGSTLATADSMEDVFFTNSIFINSISLNNGGAEIIFNKGSIKPTTYGSIVLSNSQTTYLLEINKEGLIDFYKL